MTVYVLKTYSDEHKMNASAKIRGVFTDKDKLADAIIANRNELGLDAFLSDLEIETMVYQDHWRLETELSLAGVEYFESDVFE